tara:strand:- start:2869 stop:3129 length:261 start_codon:yes stop_codon:yes gene_type:complete
LIFEMTVKLHCESCDKKFNAPENLFNQHFKWPRCSCGKTLTIISTDTPTGETSTMKCGDTEPNWKERDKSKDQFIPKYNFWGEVEE